MAVIVACTTIVVHLDFEYFFLDHMAKFYSQISKILGKDVQWQVKIDLNEKKKKNKNSH